jgi:hypothetical protein
VTVFIKDNEIIDALESPEWSPIDAAFPIRQLIIDSALVSRNKGHANGDQHTTRRLNGRPNKISLEQLGTFSFFGCHSDIFHTNPN